MKQNSSEFVLLQHNTTDGNKRLQCVKLFSDSKSQGIYTKNPNYKKLIIKPAFII